MIVFFAEGRLGNQLFQYAFLNTLSKENEKIITINMDHFVNNFDINNRNFKHYSFGKYSKFVIKKFIKSILLLCVKLKLISYIKQDRTFTSALPTYKFEKGLFPIRFVETGFFQSEKFFDKKKVDFKIKNVYINEAKKFLANIPKEFTKVFVHVRRGDYISEKYLGIKGIDLPKSYYLKAIDIVSQNLKNPFFIFLSDDPGYVECCFKDISNKIISKNSMMVDFAIMTLCEAGICSNSSFSWWGSYLMQNRKLVIMPKYWYGWKQKIESHIGIQPKWAKIIDF